MMKKLQKIRRGDIFCADLNPAVGSEQGEVRPVLVVQNNAGNTYSPTVIIVPLTGKISKNPLPIHVRIPRSCGVEHDSLALVEQIRTIDRSRFFNYIGRISGELQTAIDNALAVCVGIVNRRLPKGEALELCLCYRCEASFRDSGYAVIKKGWQEVKEDCDFCNMGKGFTFGIFNLDDVRG